MTVADREAIINSIFAALSFHAQRIADNASCNLLSLNVISETYYAGLLHELYGYSLKNTNIDSSNYRGFDLIDKKRKIIVQVTSNCRKDKLLSALKSVDVQEYAGFHFLFLLITGNGEPLRRAKLSGCKYVVFDKVYDILDNLSLKKYILNENFSIEKLQYISSYICKNVGYITAQSIEKISSDLEDIVVALAGENFEGPIAQPSGFDIDAKIDFNDLSVRTRHIMALCVYEGKLSQIYKRFDKHAQNKRFYVTRVVQDIYEHAPSDMRGVSLYDYIEEKLREKIVALNLKQLTVENMQFYAEVLVADAFVNCKIFLPPVLNV